MWSRLCVALVAITALLVTAATGIADPGLNNVSPHRHWIETANGGLAEVGPRVCDNPSLQQAFNQFHANVHFVTGSSIGPAAPGLHNFQGGEIRSSAC